MLRRFLLLCGLGTLSLFFNPVWAFEADLSSEDGMIKLKNIFQSIQSIYVRRLSTDELLALTLRGLLSSLDPHSAYLDEKDLQTLETKTTGKFVGLGVEITRENHLIKIISPIDGSPAAKAGIKAGDYILAIDRQLLTEDMTIEDVVQKLQGKEGSTVTITIANEKEKKPKVITLRRASITVPSTKSELLDGRLGYLRISQFQVQTADLVKNEVASLEKKANGKLEGLILDLRNNPGGVLEPAGEVADLFLDLPKKPFYGNRIFYTKGNNPSFESIALITKGDILNGAPIIVLINEGTASAAEIVAGALQDQKRALVVGKRSFGKGSVQAIFPLDNKSALKLTTALYYTPAGRSIQEQGIEPDIWIGEAVPSKENIENELQNVSNQIRKKNGANHLQNYTPSSNKESEQDKTLAIEDYPLYEAVQLMKGVSVYQTEKQN